MPDHGRIRDDRLRQRFHRRVADNRSRFVQPYQVNPGNFPADPAHGFLQSRKDPVNICRGSLGPRRHDRSPGQEAQILPFTVFSDTDLCCGISDIYTCYNAQSPNLADIF